MQVPSDSIVEEHMDSSTVSRTPEGYLRLLKDQYELLKEAVDDFYE
jgi:hypothetical protein